MTRALSWRTGLAVSGAAEALSVKESHGARTTSPSCIITWRRGKCLVNSLHFKNGPLSRTSAPYRCISSLGAQELWLETEVCIAWKLPNKHYALSLCQFNIVKCDNTQLPLIYLSQCYNSCYAFLNIILNCLYNKLLTKHLYSLLFLDFIFL